MKITYDDLKGLCQYGDLNYYSKHKTFIYRIYDHDLYVEIEPSISFTAHMKEQPQKVLRLFHELLCYLSQYDFPGMLLYEKNFPFLKYYAPSTAKIRELKLTNIQTYRKIRDLLYETLVVGLGQSYDIEEDYIYGYIIVKYQDKTLVLSSDDFSLILTECQVPHDFKVKKFMKCVKKKDYLNSDIHSAYMSLLSEVVESQES